MFISKKVLAAIGVIVILITVVGTAFGQGDEITACVMKNGQVRFITENNPKCKNNETPVTWNVQGPAGPQGEQGPPGPQGPPGDDFAGDIYITAPKGDKGDKGDRGNDGLDCWDIDGDGIADPNEDTNGDSLVNYLDCHGPQGEQGIQGEQGPQGEAGADGRDGKDAVSGWERIKEFSDRLEPGESDLIMIICPSEKKILGGGFDAYPYPFTIFVNGPIYDNAWQVRARNDSTVTAVFDAYAICADVIQ